MNVKLYAWADGPSFDADSFVASSHVGAVRERKQLQQGKPIASGKYWVGPEAQLGDEQLDDLLLTYLSTHRDVLSAIKDVGATRIVIQGVETCGSLDEVRGMYLSPQALRLLVELDAAFDLDIVRQVR